MKTQKFAPGIAALTILLNGCVQAPSDYEDVSKVVPAVKQYSEKQQKQVAADIEAGRVSKATATMIQDYGIMRDQARNARGMLRDR